MTGFDSMFICYNVIARVIHTIFYSVSFFYSYLLYFLCKSIQLIYFSNQSSFLSGTH